MESKDLFDEIADLEEATWAALQSSGADLVPYLAKDCIMQFPMGLKITATSEPSVRDILHSPAFVPWKSFRLSDIDVTPIGPEGAVVCYLVKATRAPASGTDAEVTAFEALCSTVWRKDGGKWFMCFHQQTLTT